jgi:4-amino-4-deoxychorismate lyase
LEVRVVAQISSQKPSPDPDRGALYGDGFFTTGLIESGLVCHLDKHLERLLNSAQRLEFTKFTVAPIQDKLVELSRTNGQAVFRVTVSRSQYQRGYAIAHEQSTDVVIHLYPWVAPPPKPCEVFFAQTPISLNTKLAGLKHLNRLDNVLAATECQLPDAEAIMCHNDWVFCGSRSNLFMRESNQWLTPALNEAGIAGITRSRLIDSAKRHGIEIRECQISRRQFERAQAAFVTNSLWGMRPISKIENKPLDIAQSCELKALLSFER